MKCSFCGTENAPGRTHCIACGNPLPVDPMGNSQQKNLAPTDITPSGGMGEPVAPEAPRVNVEYTPQEVAEVQMPTNQIKTETPSSSLLTPSEEGNRPGPWLALSVIGIAVVIIIGIIYFGYQLIFGGPAQPTVTVQPTVTSTPTVVPTTVTPTPTPTATPTLSANDIQRETDIADLKAGLERYFTDKSKYPKATNYNSMLNVLISGQYLTRRIQDPLFPTQQYQYTVDPDQQAYELIVQFETNSSTLLSGGSTRYRFRSPAKN